MTDEKEPTLREIGKDFGESKYLSWADGEKKNVLISNWGVYDKQTDNGVRLAFRCDVLNVSGIKYNLGTKVIDTTSLNFHKAIKPFLKTENQTLYLEIQRTGEKKKTVFTMRGLNLASLGDKNDN